MTAFKILGKGSISLSVSWSPRISTIFNVNQPCIDSRFGDMSPASWPNTSLEARSLFSGKTKIYGCRCASAVVGSCCLVNLFLSQPAPRGDSISGTAKRLRDLNRKLLTIGQDLLQLNKALGLRDPERDIVLPLIFSYQKTSAYVTHAEDVLWLYQNMSSAKDRENVRKDVEGLLKGLVKFFELEMEAANDAIANTNKPGIVSTATELRNTTRQIIDALNAVRL